MRIISGKYKSRQIPVRKNFPSRPTTDFAKEGIFNVIGNFFDFENIIVLDLFAGTGSIGYEFSSRGAQVDMVDSDSRSVHFINSVISDFKMDDIRVLKADVFRIASKLDKQYDIIFADPPYTMRDIETLPGLIFTSGILKPEGWFILEHPHRLSLNKEARYRETRKYGNVNFSIFTW